ncbi:MAG: fibronectin type III domain-containing protein [Clostridia bacterium]
MVRNSKKLIIGFLCAIAVICTLSISAFAATDNQVVMTTYTRTYDAIRVNWESIDGADGYRVYLQIDGTYTKVATVYGEDTTTYRLSGLNANTEYSFKVKSFTYDSTGTAVWDEASEAYSASTKTEQVQLTTYSCTYEAVRINWEAISGADGYRVYQYIDGSWKSLETVSASTLTYRIDGLDADTTYSFKVNSYVRNDEGVAYFLTTSDEYFATTLDTKAAFTTSSSTNDSITLNWDTVAYADGYRVYQQIDGTYTNIKTIGGNDSTSFTVTGLEANTEYSFKVKAYIRDDNSVAIWQDASDSLEVTTYDTQAAFKSSSSTYGTITLNWNTVTYADGYRVYQQIDGTYTNIQTISGSSSTSFTVDGLIANSDYNFKVKAYIRDENGVAIWQEASEAYSVSTQEMATPATVSGISAASVAYESILLTWDKTSTTTGYIIYVYDEDTDTYVKLGVSSTNAYIVTGLSYSTEYSFKVKAYYETEGNTSYGYESDDFVVSTKSVAVPATVSEIVSASDSSSVTLSWESIDASTGYIVYIHNGTTYVRYEVTSETTSTITDLDPLTEYWFKVKAYTKLDGYTEYGDASSQVTVSTVPDKVETFATSNVTSDSYTISWSASGEVDYYVLEEYDADLETWFVVQESSKTSYSNVILGGGEMQYRVCVVAYGEDGNKCTSGYTTLRASTLPGETEITGIASNSNSGVSIKYTAAVAASAYQIYMYDAANGEWDYIALSATTTYNHNNLDETKEYTYKVKPVSICGTNTYYGEFCESETIFFEVVDNTSIYSEIEALESNGVFGYLYDLDGYFYTSGDPWQRNFGYSTLYDVLAPLTMMNFDTDRILFDYDDQEWMVQLWKGQYGFVFYGCEVGVYNRDPDEYGDSDFYNCVEDDDMLYMSVDFYERNGWTWGVPNWELQFSRPYGSYWWCTGFVPGSTGLSYNDIKMEVRITMKDYEMLDAFIGGMEDAGFTEGTRTSAELKSYTSTADYGLSDNEFVVNGLDIYFCYRYQSDSIYL